MRRTTQALILGGLTLGLTCCTLLNSSSNYEKEENKTALAGIQLELSNTLSKPVAPAELEIVSTPNYIEVTPDDIEEEIYCDSVEYLAQCVEAEAGDQDYMGKVYVTDCILNRMDSGNYDNYFQVIDEKNQFEVVSNGTIHNIPSEETYEVVKQELENRTNYEVIFFRMDYYHEFGTQMFKHGDHYFSKE